MCSLGEPCDLRRDILPTKRDIFKYYLFLNQEKVRVGDWKQNTKLSDKAEFVRGEVADIWDKTGIPHCLRRREGLKKITSLLMDLKEMTKVAMHKRKEGFGKELDTLFDASNCQHVVREACTCEEVDKIPLTWMAFLSDQRGERQLQGVLHDRTLSLRAAGIREREEQEAKEIIRYKVEKQSRRKGQEEERAEKSKKEIVMLLENVPLTEELLEELDGERKNDPEEIVEDIVSAEEVQDDDSDSDWEELPADGGCSEDTSTYNTMGLKYFSRECDRYGISDRAAAKVGNALMKDLGIVKKGNTSKLICPSKVRRERCKWGNKLAKEYRETKLPAGLYTDGKRVPTLNRVTTVTKVRVPGRRGKAAWRNVTSINNTMIIEDHYPVVSQPGGEYVDHVTPKEGTGRSLAQELFALISERNCNMRVIGMDGCAVNTGIHNGAIRQLEIMLDNPLQHAICGLHLNELLFWHILSETDGVTKGPDSLSGPVGSTLTEDIWKHPVVSFKKISGKVPALPDIVVQDLSRDQHLAYRYAHAIMSGVIEDNLVSQVLGPLCTARWVTTGLRIMCKYTRTVRPSKGLIRLVVVILNLYLPGWFKFKCHPHIQDGAKNYYYLVDLSRSLPRQDMEIAQKVLQDNAYWPHGENLAIAMLSDSREEIRRKAVLWVMKARREHNPDSVCRKFVPPVVNFGANNYFDLIDWNEVPCTEPPLTMDIMLDDILKIIGAPLVLPNYPNHTQSVERMVRVVSEVASQRAGYNARHRTILKLLESRSLVPKFNTKKNDAVF